MVYCAGALRHSVVAMDGETMNDITSTICKKRKADKSVQKRKGKKRKVDLLLFEKRREEKRKRELIEKKNSLEYRFQNLLSDNKELQDSFDQLKESHDEAIIELDQLRKVNKEKDIKIGELKIENEAFTDRELKHLDKIGNMNERMRDLELRRLFHRDAYMATENEKIKKNKNQIHDFTLEKEEIIFMNNSLHKTKLGLGKELEQLKTDRQKNNKCCESLVSECEKLQEEGNQLKKDKEKLQLEIEKFKKNVTFEERQKKGFVILSTNIFELRKRRSKMNYIQK